ncbi:MAG TPA: hypothetical protein VHK67_01375 [Rhabdochlamydiaceae bacterium]|nr:hypothetical protein [Rhabdochlamydiaceae bacterium]
MTIRGVFCLIHQVGVGCASARAYEATLEQAVFFSAINGVVECVLGFSAIYFLRNTRELALAAILVKTIAALAGVLATRIFCYTMIQWKQAVASVTISTLATMWVISISGTPTPIPKLNA